jgi:hypothetical protein
MTAVNVPEGKSIVTFVSAVTRLSLDPYALLTEWSRTMISGASVA